MGQKARTLVGADVDHIITLLRKAYADEWLAMIQYETAAFQAKGIMRTDVVRDLKENAMEEYDHAMKLGRRICELGGTVPLTPEEMIKESNCAYIKPGESCLGPPISGSGTLKHPFLNGVCQRQIVFIVIIAAPALSLDFF